jgi:hypothetical protein
MWKTNQGVKNMSRQALELALEALQFALHVGFPESSESQIKKGEKAYQQHRAAITAIKEALAQPTSGDYALGYSIGFGEGHSAGKAFAQPEQKPVATLDDLEQEIYENTRQFVSRDVMEWMLKRYYTTPPQRKPLTDEEIDRIWVPHTFIQATDRRRQAFARAIEAAHGIKE